MKTQTVNTEGAEDSRTCPVCHQIILFGAQCRCQEEGRERAIKAALARISVQLHIDGDGLFHYRQNKIDFKVFPKGAVIHLHARSVKFS